MCMYIMFFTFAISFQCNYSIFISLLFFHVSKIHNNKMILSHSLGKTTKFSRTLSCFFSITIE